MRMYSNRQMRIRRAASKRRIERRAKSRNSTSYQYMGEVIYHQLERCKNLLVNTNSESAKEITSKNWGY